MKTNQKTVVHDSLRFQELTISINLSEPGLKHIKTDARTRWRLWMKQIEVGDANTLWTYLMRSWYQLRWRRNTKLRSLSLRVVVSSISPSGISVVRPKDDPFRSNRLWIRYSEQNKLPITMNRVCFPITIHKNQKTKNPCEPKRTQICPHNTLPSGHQLVWHNALQRILSPGNFHTDAHVGNNLEAFLLAPIKRLPNLRFQSNCPTSNVSHFNY